MIEALSVCFKAFMLLCSWLHTLILKVMVNWSWHITPVLSIHVITIVNSISHVWTCYSPSSSKIEGKKMRDILVFVFFFLKLCSVIELSRLTAVWQERMDELQNLEAEVISLVLFALFQQPLWHNVTLPCHLLNRCWPMKNFSFHAYSRVQNSETTGVSVCILHFSNLMQHFIFGVCMNFTSAKPDDHVLQHGIRMLQRV